MAQGRTLVVSERPLLIVNPRAGGGRAGRIFGEMRAPVTRALGAFDEAFTRSEGHAIALAEEASRAGRELLVAVGGDGTLHEVVNGVLRAATGKTAVGFIGQGTGGDFRRSLRLEHRLDKYLAAIASGREREIDAGKLWYRGADGEERERFFVNIVSAGMGGLVDRYVAETSKAAGGKVAYFAASVRALARCREGRLRCSVTRAGETSERRIRSYMIAICNGRWFGSAMHVAPMAEIDDGKLEVVSIGAPSKLALAASAQKIYSGAHLREPGVVSFACEKIAIDLENEEARGVFLLDVDGEPLGGLPMRVEVMPRALRVRA
jgi:YegS/Rv2252/BmrU family lipid kinase